LTAAAHVPGDVETYLARVRDALSDLPVEERNELLAEVEPSLYESASEAGGSVAARLGPPEDFAAELRSAAGLQESEAPRPAGLRETIDRALADRRVETSLGYARQLGPAWWVARGYLVVAGLALLFGASWSVAHGAVPRIGSATVGLVVILLAIAGSVALGLWGRGRIALAVVNLLAVVAVIPVAQHLSHGTPVQTTIVTVPAIQPGLSYNGVPVDNIYPYSRSGKLLHDVFLFTGSGAPLNVSTVAPDPDRRVPVTKTGRRVFNAFPIRYYEPATKIVLRPNAAPRVHVPKLKTRPLR
jgi:uncharacterized membrane protein